MELKNSRPIFILSSIWLVILLAIALWWSYLFLNLGTTQIDFNNTRFTNMIKWEGAVFIVLLLSTSSLLFYYIYRDQKKIKSMQSFFASLTHELKTPLASVRLQAEVIKSLNIESNVTSYVDRLVEDVTKLENHMDKTLQLSRVERQGNLNLEKINIIDFINKVSNESHFDVRTTLDTKSKFILADEFALKIIFRNLIENTKEHTQEKKSFIFINEVNNMIQVTYRDAGLYQGDCNKLGTLFFKHQSSKGSGIGIYLIKKLIKSMHGELKITNHHHLNFKMSFKAAQR